MRKRTVKLISLGTNAPQGVKAIRVLRDTDWNEYQVQAIREAGRILEDETYFTDDKDDALDTADAYFKYYSKPQQDGVYLQDEFEGIQLNSNRENDNV